MRYLPMPGGGFAVFLGLAGFVTTLLLIAAAVAVLILVSRRTKHDDPAPPRPVAPPAVHILDERLARGEIEIDDYLNRKAALLGGVGGPSEWKPGPTEPPSTAPSTE